RTPANISSSAAEKLATTITRNGPTIQIDEARSRRRRRHDESLFTEFAIVDAFYGSIDDFSPVDLHDDADDGCGPSNTTAMPDSSSSVDSFLIETLSALLPSPSRTPFQPPAGDVNDFDNAVFASWDAAAAAVAASSTLADPFLHLDFIGSTPSAVQLPSADCLDLPLVASDADASLLFNDFTLFDDDAALFAPTPAAAVPAGSSPAGSAATCSPPMDLDELGGPSLSRTPFVGDNITPYATPYYAVAPSPSLRTASTPVFGATPRTPAFAATPRTPVASSEQLVTLSVSEFAALISAATASKAASASASASAAAVDGLELFPSISGTAGPAEYAADEDLSDDGEDEAPMSTARQPLQRVGRRASSASGPPGRVRRRVTKLHICASPGCGKAFTRAFNLKTHELTHLATRDRPFACDQCDKTFYRVHDLNRHVVVHDTVRGFACDTCGKAFARNDALRRHQATTIRCRDGQADG
ncbi:hypothetical protein HK405_011344, partial [Cladochytrium tenue]